jgi:hypothetical protein
MTVVTRALIGFRLSLESVHSFLREFLILRVSIDALPHGLIVN